MMKGFFLLAAMLGLTVIGTASTTAATRAPASPASETDFGACRYYCGSHSYTTLAQCSAVCGGPSNCDKIC